LYSRSIKEGSRTLSVVGSFLDHVSAVGSFLDHGGILSRMEPAGHGIVERVAVLARHSDSAEHYTRLYLTPAHRAAARQIAAWMRSAGMAVRVDSIGNVIGRYEAATPGAKTLLFGSHFDSVRNGGRFDGNLGILVPIACAGELNARGERLPVAIEVAAFAEEEGARFSTGFLASQAFIGRFDTALLNRRDPEGITLREALVSAGHDPHAVGRDRIDAKTLAAYVELHIEQGPVLLNEGLALGVVTTIAGGNRHAMRVIGHAGHAGTTPMKLRHDALAAACEMVLAIERRAAPSALGEGRGEGQLVATVGILRVKEGSSNVIPGEVEFSVDIRAGDDATRRAAEDEVFAECAAIASRRGVVAEHARVSESKVVPCTPWVQDLIAESVAAVGVQVRRLPSGAGHDAMVLSEVCAVGMLFVRCGAGGVSHNPAETVTPEDAGLAARALLDLMRRFRQPS
jgi:hydantoinase/carbamoylase family amidase